MSEPEVPDLKDLIATIPIESLGQGGLGRYTESTASTSANTLITGYYAFGGAHRADEGVEIGRAVEKLSSPKKNELKRRIEMTKRVPPGYGVPPGVDPLDALAIVTAVIEDEDKKERQAAEGRQISVALRIAWIGLAGSLGAATIAFFAGLAWG